jgi:hypothetical protein
MLCQSDAAPLFLSTIFVANQAGEGGAWFVESGNPSSMSCTFYGNQSGSGSSIKVNSDTVTVEHSIIAFAPFGEAVTCAGGVVNLTCTDIYANLGGNWTGCIASQLGQNGNFSANPLFCDATNRDFTIRAASPCAPANSPPGCGLIGALPVGCGIADVALPEEAPSADLKLVVIPNPVRGVARFELESAGSLSKLRIFDSQGRLIEQLSSQDGRWQWTPAPSVPAGVYFARPELDVSDGQAVKFLYLR